MKLYILKIKGYENDVELACFTKKSADKALASLPSDHGITWYYERKKCRLTFKGWILFFFGYRYVITEKYFSVIKDGCR